MKLELDQRYFTNGHYDPQKSEKVRKERKSLKPRKETSEEIKSINTAMFILDKIIEGKVEKKDKKYAYWLFHNFDQKASNVGITANTKENLSYVAEKAEKYGERIKVTPFVILGRGIFFKRIGIKF